MAHKVFVGLSGGVDSAVAAALLKERKLDVTGVFIKIWQPEFSECTWREDRLDAMRVAVALDIPYREIDLSQEYKKEVVEYMVRSYERGITPNPDVLCNRHIKFGAFSKWALEQGAQAVATGHYALVGQTGGRFELARAKDPAKDQSYFLYRLDQRDLSHAMFPIGAYTKPQVRALARKFALPVAQKPDSQGLCFVGAVSLPEFLSHYLTLRDGSVVGPGGKTIGVHHGAALYTVGQRHGFEIEGGAAQKGPYYVVGVDVKANVIRVSPERTDAARKGIALADEHWIAGLPSVPIRVQVQTRYHEKPVYATISKADKGLAATFDEAHVASAGQSIVFYDNDTVLGGAVIA